MADAAAATRDYLLGTLVLIAWPETTWSAEGRFAGRTPVSLTDKGRQQAADWGTELSGMELGSLLSSGDSASIETAEVMDAVCPVKRRVEEGLVEVDLGLWDGLSAAEVKRRYPKIYKLWQQDPTSVCPPEGEEIMDARARLRKVLGKILKRLGDKAAGIIVGPLAFVLLRSLIEATEASDLRFETPDQPLTYRPLVYGATITKGSVELVPARMGSE